MSVEHWRYQQRARLFARYITSGTAWGNCPCCERFTRSLAFRRRNTAYADERSNYLLSCPDCYEEDAEHWDEMWSEYYASVL